jgi:flavin reductase
MGGKPRRAGAGDRESSLICRRVHCHEFGTHSIFIGELAAAHHRKDATPLTYYDRHYIDISEAPERAPR